MKIVKQSVNLEWITPNSEEVIERAARTCYQSQSTGDPGEFIKRLITSGHESTIEHASASFRIICDRGISHEIVRHRIASYSQESSRYCNYSKGKFGNEITVIEPFGLNNEQYNEWEYSCNLAEDQYFCMIDNGSKPDQARSVLPTCLKTELVMTTNFREWRHFIKLRTSKAAHPQIRFIADEICSILKDKAPNVFGDLLVVDGENNIKV